MTHITNVTTDAVDSDHVRTRSSVDAIVLGADDASGVNARGFYDDELVRTAEGWRIARRRYTEVHTALLPERLVF